MGWGSSITGDSAKEALYFPLEVTNALAALVSHSSGMEDGEGLGFWLDFVFGLVTGAMAKVVGMAEAAEAEVRHWLILVRVYLCTTL
jgi:hypothetical protein